MENIMKTYKLTFNNKSKALKIPEAIKIARSSFPKTTTETNNSISIISFKYNRSFKNILELVKSIKGTILEIDNEKIGDLNQFIEIMECDSKQRCQGICTAIGDYDFQLEYIGIIPKESSQFYNSARWRLYYHDDVIATSTSKLLTLKRDVYLQHYLEDTSVAKNICPKYNLDKIIQSFDTLQSIIKIDLSDDYSSMFDQFIDRKQCGESEKQEGEMVVDLSNKSIKAIGEELANRLAKLLKT